MNLRLARNQLHFKISAEELDQLRAGETLEESVTIGALPLRLRIEPHGEGMAPVFEPAPDAAIRLPVAPGLLDELHALGRDKDGLSRYNGDTPVTLQVDVRSRKPAQP